MKSQFESADHTKIHDTKEALRAHAIDKRTPERVIALLEVKGHKDASGFLTRILTGDLTGKDRGIIRKIDASAIPSITPIKAPEEPTRRLKDTSGLKPDPYFDNYRRDMSSLRIARRSPASPAPESLVESIPAGHVMVNLSSLVIVGERGTIISEETWGNIKLLKKGGKLIIEERGEYSVSFDFEYSGGMIYRTEMKTDLENTIAAIVEELKWKGIIAPEEKLETQKPSKASTSLTPLETIPPGYVLINLNMLIRTAARSNAILVKDETWEQIQLLKTRGELEISRNEMSAADEVIIFFQPHLQDGQDYPGSGYRSGSIDGSIHSLVEELRSYGVLPAEGKLESPKPDPYEIYLNTFDDSNSSKPVVGIEMSPETRQTIDFLRRFGRISICKYRDKGGVIIDYRPNGWIGRLLCYSGNIDTEIAKLKESLTARNLLGTNAQESIPPGYVMVNLSNLVIVGERGRIISEKTWNNIQLLRSVGTLHIEEFESTMGNQVRIFYALSSQPGQYYPGNCDRNGDLDESIDSLVEELRSYGVLSAAEEAESPKPSTVRIYLDTLEIVTGRGDGLRGIEVSQETWETIQKLQKLGTLTITKNVYTNFSTCSFISKDGRRGPFTAHGRTLDNSVINILIRLKELNLLSETPDTIEIDITTLLNSSAHINPPVFAITPENLENIEILKKLGKCRIYEWSLGWGLELIIPDDHRNYHWPTTKVDNEFIESIVRDLREKGKFPHSSANSEQAESIPSDTVKIDIDDVAECPDTGKGPGVVTILRKTLEDIERLQIVGELKIFATKKPNKFTLIYEDFIGHIDRELLLVGIDEGIAILVPEAEHYYAKEMKV